MNKIKFLTKFILLFLFLGVAFQCEPVPCDCPENVKPFISIDGIGLLHRDDFGVNILENSKVIANRHRLVAPILTSFTTQNENLKLNNPFINSVLACDCAFDGQFGLKAKAKSISFRLMSDYDATYKKGDSINDIIEIEDRGVFPVAITSFDNVINEINIGNFFAGERFAYKLKHTNEFQKRLNNEKDGVPFQVEIDLILDDGSSEKGFSQKIYLTN